EFKETVFDDSAYFYWCIDGKVLAVLWLGPVNIYSKTAEFGVIALKGGEGHGREATKALLNYGFKTIGLHRLFCTVLATNVNCLKAIEKFGLLKSEGRLRDARFIGGEYVDLLSF